MRLSVLQSLHLKAEIDKILQRPADIDVFQNGKPDHQLHIDRDAQQMGNIFSGENLVRHLFRTKAGSLSGQAQIQQNLRAFGNQGDMRYDIVLFKKRVYQYSAFTA